jgi:antitoxin CcdA
MRKEVRMGEKRPVNLSVDAELVDRARAAGINLSHTLEARLRDAIREADAEAWREQNREAIRRANDELERDGLWSDGLWLF